MLAVALHLRGQELSLRDITLPPAQPGRSGLPGAVSVQQAY
jgi:hypothetical protein